jgi:hypothetical protein
VCIPASPARCHTAHSYTSDWRLHLQVDGQLQHGVFPCTFKKSRSALYLSGVPLSARRHLVRLGLRCTEDGTLVLVTRTATPAELQQAGQEEAQQQGEQHQEGGAGSRGDGKGSSRAACGQASTPQAQCIGVASGAAGASVSAHGQVCTYDESPCSDNLFP